MWWGDRRTTIHHVQEYSKFRFRFRFWPSAMDNASLTKRGVDGVGNWSLVSIAPYSEVMQPVYKMIFEIFLVFFIITSILIVLIVVFSRTITRPIVELEKAIANFEINRKPINIKGWVPI